MRARWVVAVVALLIACGGLARIYLRSRGGRHGVVAAPSAIVPAGERIKVEVLNATETKGLARRAMLTLRSAGFDVVFFGNSSERADTTRILDRSGHPAWAREAAKAMGGARVEEAPDSSRFLDLTVLIGRNWTPPGEPLRP